MGTKNNPGEFDCYDNAGPDEPMFVLLARDPLAPILVDLWASMRTLAFGNPAKIHEARVCAEAMRKHFGTIQMIDDAYQSDPTTTKEEQHQ